MNVLVIGGGVAGCATAWHLARDGVSVTLVERDELNLQASGSNAGSLHAQIQHEPFRNEPPGWTESFLPALPFFAWSIQLWRDLDAQFAVDLEVVTRGGVIVATTSKEMRHVEVKAAFEQRAGIATELLDRNALLERASYLSSNVCGGAFCPLEGKANPLRAAPVFAEAAMAAGAKLLTRTSVRQISCHDGVFEVTTSSGTLHADRIVNAAGIDAGKIAALVGRQLSVKAYPIQLSVTEAVAPLISHLVYSAESRLTLKQAKNGTILIGGGWPADVDSQKRPQVSAESLSRNLAAALSLVPSLADVNVARCWAAAVNGTDDWLPVLGELPECPGFFMNYVPWMGFTGGPGGARIVSNLVQGREAPVDFDIEPFAP